MVEPFIISAIIFSGAGLLHLWMKTDPNENFLPFWVIRLKYLKAKKDTKSKKLSSKDFPQFKLSDLELGVRILIVEFTYEGDLLCRKVLDQDHQTFFVVQDYECNEPFKILDRIYEVRFAYGLKQLEYCKERLTHDVHPSVGIYVNLNNIPIIRAKAA